MSAVTVTERATELLVEHSRCRPSTARTGDGKVIYDCGIAVPLHLASHHAHLSAALARAGLLGEVRVDPRYAKRRHHHCGLGDPDTCGHPDCPGVDCTAEGGESGEVPR